MKKAEAFTLAKEHYNAGLVKPSQPGQGKVAKSIVCIICKDSPTLLVLHTRKDLLRVRRLIDAALA